jgi:hypothetical protein
MARLLNPISWERKVRLAVLVNRLVVQPPAAGGR